MNENGGTQRNHIYVWHSFQVDILIIGSFLRILRSNVILSHPVQVCSARDEGGGCSSKTLMHPQPLYFSVKWEELACYYAALLKSLQIETRPSFRLWSLPHSLITLRVNSVKQEFFFTYVFVVTRRRLSKNTQSNTLRHLLVFRLRRHSSVNSLWSELLKKVDGDYSGIAVFISDGPVLLLNIYCVCVERYWHVSFQSIKPLLFSFWLTYPLSSVSSCGLAVSPTDFLLQPQVSMNI